MKVAIVHYHLEPGGVTKVIENTLLAWEKSALPIQAVALSGRPYQGKVIPQTQVVEGLDYATPKESIAPDILAQRLKDAAKESLGSSPDLWHIHNHSLGKNPALTAAVRLLAEQGEYLLLHPHDFAEDGRPQNFLSLSEVYGHSYPTSERIRYAVLNHRDKSFLQKLTENSESEVHLLANAIPFEEAPRPSAPTNSTLPENLYLYPVRAVRRKNLGELALLSAAYPEKHFANSLGPTNPAFLDEFESWKSFCLELGLAVTYGLGESVSCSFPEMIEHSEAIVSTSVAEGFGLGFLEPWTFDKGLCGRNIPEITKDFSELGIELGHLYERVETDLALLADPTSLSMVLEGTLKGFYHDYGREMPENATRLAYHSMVRHERVDFGRLHEPMQKEILRNMVSSPSDLADLRDQLNLVPPAQELVAKNKDSVNKNFGLEAYGQRLWKMYCDTLSGQNEKITFADGEQLLECFLCPTRLNLLRTK